MDRAENIRALRAALLDWYTLHRRDLPWRRQANPYAVWVSEVMLQQTRVSVVMDYFHRWMERFPTLERLARASEDEVLQVWQGLGYYSRARRLRQGALYVCREFGGRLPRDVPSLLTIPGVGPYSAGAIASIAYGVPAPIVDGNIVRVLSRLFALDGDLTKAAMKRTLWSLAAELVPTERAADFNQAMMELGALVCTPKRPSCDVCPVQKRCVAWENQLVDQLPRTPPRAEATEVETAAALIERRGRWLVVRLASDAPRWAGMWVFPTVELAGSERAFDGARRAARELTDLSVVPRRELLRLRHQVTRFRITLHAVLCDGAAGRVRLRGVAAFAWKRPEELASLAMPAAQRRVAQRLLDSTKSGSHSTKPTSRRALPKERRARSA